MKIDVKITMASGRHWTIKDIKTISYEIFLNKNLSSKYMTFLNDGENGTGKPFTLPVNQIESIECLESK